MRETAVGPSPASSPSDCRYLRRVDAGSHGGARYGRRSRSQGQPVTLAAVRTPVRTLLVRAFVAGAVWTSGCGEQSQQPMPSTEAGTTLPVCSLAPQQCQDDPSCAFASTACDGGVVGTWNAMDCALELTGEVDVRGLGLGCAYGT